MSKDILQWVLDALGLGGVISVIALISWTKITLGSVLTLCGAFFPTHQRQKRARVRFKWRGAAVLLEGGTRFLVSIAGVILVVGGILESHDRYVYGEPLATLVGERDPITFYRRLAECMEPSRTETPDLAASRTYWCATFRDDVSRAAYARVGSN